jgi:AcrR family transcriptional regulator
VKEPGLSSPFSRDYQREQKRRAILSEASRLFNIHGARATKLDDISARLNLNKASLYYYVKSKDDLIYQCYLASCETLSEMIYEADRQSRTGAGKLTAFILAYFMACKEIMEGGRHHMAILSETRALKPEHRKIVAARYSEIQGRVRSFIRMGRDDGSLQVASEIDAALALFGLLQLTVLWLPQTDPEGYGQAAEDFIDIVFNGITAAQPGVDRQASALAENGIDRAATAEEGDRLADFCRIGSAYFNSKGFKGASLDEIAETLKLTKGSFYYHVRDKDELLYRCFRRSLAIIQQAQEASAVNAACGLEALQRCAFHLFRIQNSNSGPLIRFSLIPSLSETHRKEILAGIAGVTDRFGDMIREGIDDGSVRTVNPFIAEQILVSAVDLSTELQWQRPVEDLLADARVFFEFYFDGISGERRRLDE